MDKEKRWVKVTLIATAIAYLALVLFIPAVNVFVQAFQEGVGVFLGNFTELAFLNAIRLTLLIALIVVPINTVFGLCAAWAIARHQFPGRPLLISILDLPFAISPIVVGLMMILLYGSRGWFAPVLETLDLQIISLYPAWCWQPLLSLFPLLPAK